MSVIIETENLTKIYRVGGREIRAVDNLNLKVYEGDVFGYLGPNGAGKTTTILMLLGLIMPTSGGGRVCGYDIIRESRKVRSVVGYVPEKYSFYEDMTAYDNLRYFAKLNGIPDGEIDDRIRRALEIVELQDRAGSLVATFSRGMKQRLALANTLIKNPKLIFLDEPTAGLDPYATASFRELMRKLNREFKTTIFISSHMLHEVRQLCNRIGFLNEGKLIAVDTIDEFLRKAGVRIVLEVVGGGDEVIKVIEGVNGVNRVLKRDEGIVVYAGSDVRLEIVDLVMKMGLKILTVKVEPPTLEEVFFTIYGGGVR
ncbi:MAG: ABC transporter ATP-binding protein [Candidatus Verstraetearchaeota archaeon]|nr:ABC transporter ATP-binding protein [Candidatus Verstraetearchaeota archaeon]